jgi:catechol 2,3-dioxygenase
MKVQTLGHVVIKVRNQERAEAFYNGVLGIPIAARHETMPMTFFTLGNHHDLAVLATEDDAPAPPKTSPGLFHIALKVGDSLDELRETKAKLEEAGVKVDAIIDHEVSKSIYIRDPDGNGVELYVDASDSWKTDPSRVAQGEPMTL